MKDAEKATASITETIAVCIRVRPLTDREHRNLDANILDIIPNVQAITILDPQTRQPLSGKNNVFQYDHIFGPSHENQDIYRKVARDIVFSSMSGINGTIFAYGQTSSGKTYTMQGGPGPGILQFAVNDIFQYIENCNDRDFLLRVAYFEIYNEIIRDLLTPKEDKVLKIREDPKRKGVFVESHEEIIIHSKRITELLEAGNQKRSIGSTRMNENSSRSHSIFRIIIESKQKKSQTTDLARRNSEDDVNGAVLVASLDFVDLAGSESLRHTMAEGMRQREAGNINKSLLTLSRVIHALASNPQQTTQISCAPFRDSKLTRLLQTSLDGNTRTLMICCVTPSDQFLEETKSTLQFAARAKKIQTSAIVNEILDDQAQLLRLKKEVRELRKRILETESVTALKAENEGLLKKQKEIERYMSIGGRLSRKKSKRNRETWSGGELRSSLESLQPLKSVKLDLGPRNRESGLEGLETGLENLEMGLENAEMGLRKRESYNSLTIQEMELESDGQIGRLQCQLHLAQEEMNVIRQIRLEEKKSHESEMNQTVMELSSQLTKAFEEIEEVRLMKEEKQDQLQESDADRVALREILAKEKEKNECVRALLSRIGFDNSKSEIKVLSQIVHHSELMKEESERMNVRMRELGETVLLQREELCMALQCTNGWMEEKKAMTEAHLSRKKKVFECERLPMDVCGTPESDVKIEKGSERERLKDEERALELQLRMAQERGEELRAENDVLRAEMEELRQKLENDCQEVKRLKEVHENDVLQIQKLQQARESDYQEIQKLQQARENDVFEIKQLQEARESDCQEIQQLQQAKENDVREVQKLQQSRESDRQTIQQLQQAKENDVQTIHKLQQACEIDGRKIQKLQKADQNDCQKIQQLQQAHENDVLKIKQLQQALENDRQMIQKLQEANENDRQTIHKVQQTKENDCREIQRFRQAHENDCLTIQKLQQAHESDGQEIQRLRQAHESNCQTIQQLKQSHENDCHTIHELQKAHENDVREIQQLRQSECQELYKAKALSQRKIIDALNAEKKALSVRCSQWQHDSNLLRTENDTFKAEIARILEERDMETMRKASEIAQLQAQHEQTLQKAKAQMEKQLLHSQKCLERTYQDKLQSLTITLNQQKVDLEEKETKKQQLQCESYQLRNELEDWKEALQAAQTKATDAESRLLSTIQEHEQSEKLNAQYKLRIDKLEQVKMTGETVEFFRAMQKERKELYDKVKTLESKETSPSIALLQAQLQSSQEKLEKVKAAHSEEEKALRAELKKVTLKEKEALQLLEEKENQSKTRVTYLEKENLELLLENRQLRKKGVAGSCTQTVGEIDTLYMERNENNSSKTDGSLATHSFLTQDQEEEDARPECKQQ